MNSPTDAGGEKSYVLKFNATKNNDAEHALRLRQRDVKQAWNLRLNDKKLATLLQDEKDTVLYFKAASRRPHFATAKTN
jgi:hypothetical protein